MHLLLQLLLVVLLLALEKRMILYAKSGLGGQYTLTYHKPRMLFYAGYDISWNQSIPPLWTYFS